MGSICCSTRITALAAVFLFSAAIPLGAQEEIPLPSVDYRTTAEMPEGGTMVSRHSNGKMRVEMQVPGMKESIVSYIDLKARTGITVMTQPGMPKMAVEVDLSDEEGFGVAMGRGKRIGSDTVAGEACDLWQIEAEAGDEEEEIVGCITKDGIPLRFEATFEGKRETAFEVTEVERGPQDPKLFTPPADVKVMRMPDGMPPMMKK